jgi:hypothetical protein
MDTPAGKRAVVADWHRNGWLRLVHHHLASLARFSTLLRLAAERTEAPLDPADGASVGDMVDG